MTKRMGGGGGGGERDRQTDRQTGTETEKREGTVEAKRKIDIEKAELLTVDEAYKMYSDPHLALKDDFCQFTAAGTFISVSSVPHCLLQFLMWVSFVANRTLH